MTFLPAGNSFPIRSKNIVMVSRILLWLGKIECPSRGIGSNPSFGPGADGGRQLNGSVQRRWRQLQQSQCFTKIRSYHIWQACPAPMSKGKTRLVRRRPLFVLEDGHLLLTEKLFYPANLFLRLHLRGAAEPDHIAISRLRSATVW